MQRKPEARCVSCGRMLGEPSPSRYASCAQEHYHDYEFKAGSPGCSICGYGSGALQHQTHYAASVLKSIILQPLEKTKIIAFGHKARHGKDTAATLVKEYLGRRAKHYSFAGDLYAVCRVLHGMMGKDAPLLQRVGMEFREHLRDDVWIRSVYSQILNDQPEYALISDLRFPNEVEFVRRMGGHVVRIVRHTTEGETFVDPSRPADHTSEVALDGFEGWDATVFNWEPLNEDRFRMTLLDTLRTIGAISA